MCQNRGVWERPACQNVKVCIGQLAVQKDSDLASLLYAKRLQHCRCVFYLAEVRAHVPKRERHNFGGMFHQVCQVWVGVAEAWGPARESICVGACMSA